MRHKYLVEILSSLLILLFVYTAVNKIVGYSSFQTVLAQSPLIGSFAAVIAWFLPLVELGTASLLLFGTTRKAGFYAAASLLLVFTGYITYMLLFSPHLPCSCGGVLKFLSWQTHLLFNVFWILLAMLGLRLMGGMQPAKYQNRE
ncbi:MAG: hypothetical protein HYU71_15820 [Bacteroidetes bacterium]|nr:hypothetical protein [Bacteroidota bacterium]